MSKIYEIGGQGNENFNMIQAWNLKVWVKKISSGKLKFFELLKG